MGRGVPVLMNASSGVALTGDRVAVDVEGAVSDPLPAELGLHAPTPGLAEATTELRIAEHAAHGVGERARVAWRDEQTRLTLDDDLADPADRARDDGCPARHRLEIDQAERLVDRRAHEDGRVAVELDDVLVRQDLV